MQLSLEVKGFKELERLLKKAPQHINQTERVMLKTATLMAEGKAKEKAPIDKSTLRGSITSKITQQGKDMVGIVGTNVEYAPYQEYGTGIYAGRGMITPKRAKMLRWKKNGRYIFAHAVRGVKGKHYMKAGFDAVKNHTDIVFRQGVKFLKKKLSF